MRLSGQSTTCRLALAVAATAASACFSVAPPRQYTCSAQAPSCPAGQTCRDNLCVEEGVRLDSAIADARRPDANRLAGDAVVDISDADATQRDSRVWAREAGPRVDASTADSSAPTLAASDDGERKLNGEPGHDGESFSSGGWLEANVDGTYSSTRSHSAPLSLLMQGSGVSILTRSFGIHETVVFEAQLYIEENGVQTPGCGTGGGPFLELTNVAQNTSVSFGNHTGTPKRWSYRIGQRPLTACGPARADTGSWHLLKIEFASGAVTFHVDDTVACSATAPVNTVQLMQLRGEAGTCASFRFFWDDIRLLTN